MKNLIVLAFTTLFVLSPVKASDELNADQIKALFTDKTFDIHNVNKDKQLKGYGGEDGRHMVYIPWKDKISIRKWWIEGNMHCTSHPKRGDACKILKDVGGGVYHGISNGKHTHTLSNFRAGNHL